MRKVYCDLCGYEFDNSVRQCADSFYINKGQKISIELNVADFTDVCNDCRAKILGAAKIAGEKIKEELENERKES